MTFDVVIRKALVNVIVVDTAAEEVVSVVDVVIVDVVEVDVVVAEIEFGASGIVGYLKKNCNLFLF